MGFGVDLLLPQQRLLVVFPLDVVQADQLQELLGGWAVEYDLAQKAKVDLADRLYL